MSINLQDPFLIAYFNGFGGAISIFFLGMFGGHIKTCIESKKEDKIAIEVLKNNLERNKKILKENTERIEHELSIIKKEQTIVNPLLGLNEYFINFLFINIPKKIKKDKDTFLKLGKVIDLTKEYNEIVNSREAYRINNGAMSNYSSRMEKYDHILQENTEKFNPIIESLISKI